MIKDWWIARFSKKQSIDSETIYPVVENPCMWCYFYTNLHLTGEKTRPYCFWCKRWGNETKPHITCEGFIHKEDWAKIWKHEAWQKEEDFKRRMKKVYITHSSKYPNYQTEIYDIFREIQQELNGQVEFILPHDGTPIISKQIIRTADLVIADCTYTSVGMGIEIGWADAFNTRLAFFHKHIDGCVVIPSIGMIINCLKDANKKGEKYWYYDRDSYKYLIKCCLKEYLGVE